MTPQPLPLTDTPILPLREAYELCETIKARCTFEQALTIKRYEICIRCRATAIVKARKSNG